MKYNYVDLFSGAGGLGLGFENVGFKNLFSVEINKSAAETYKKNFPKNKLIISDIKDIDNNELKKLINNQKVDVVIGGPPCQGFSIAGNIGRKFIDDERNLLFKEFVRVVHILKPNIFVMENVARMATHKNGKTIKEICKEFTNLGYSVQFKVLNAVDYNVPQNRRRIFVVGTRNRKFKFPKPNNNRYTVRDAIDDLPELVSGESSNFPNHNAMNHTEQMLKKMSFVKDGGDRFDIPEELRPKSGDARKYIRYASNKPSITITGDMRKVFHYSQNRALTPRELARIQTFPDDFIFLGNSISIQQQIGNAVPPNLAEAVANEVKKSLQISGRQYDLPNINYIGNKNKIVNWIIDNIPEDVDTVLDAFAGGGSVSYSLKRAGYSVISNDILYSSYVINKAFIENKSETLKRQDIDQALLEVPSNNVLSRVKAVENVLYFDYEIDELAKLINFSEKLSGYKKYLYLALLRRAMIRKLPYSRMNVGWNNIKKLRDEDYSYKKYGRRRAYHNKSFVYHMKKDLENYNNAVFDNKKNNKVYQDDVIKVIKNINKVDMIYLDPPYPGTMNNYDGFYDKFDLIFNKKKNHVDLTKKENFIKYVEKIIKISAGVTKYLIISINSNSKPSYKEIINICKRYGTVDVLRKKHNYQVSGKENKNSNVEILIKVRY